MPISFRGRAVAALVAMPWLMLRCQGACTPPRALEVRDILVSQESANAHPFGVDICLDATPSMEGFATPESSVYRTFIEDLEGSLGSGVKNVKDLRFFKFGQAIREVRREEFRHARERGFYHEPGIFKDTNIELVFQRDAHATSGRAADGADAHATAASRVIVVVTDLFQKDQDVNGVVQQVKSHCLNVPQCSVGLMAIPSQFAGTVYDARVPSYPYQSTDDVASYRPFYLMMFGPETDLRHFAEVLSARKYIDLHRFTIIGGYTVAAFSVDVTRDSSMQGVTPRKHCGSALDSAFNLRRNFDQAAIKARVKVTPDPQSYPVDLSRVEIRVFREQNGRLVDAAGEVTARTTAKGGVVDFDASARPPGKPGEYSYVFEVLAGQINGFALPHWVSEFSSSDPRPDRGAGKTLNLDRFVEQMIATSIVDDSHRPKLARFRVLIHKL